MNTAADVSAPSDEAARLRHLLEVQPGCLMRVARDGRLLAVNEAALRLLGAVALDAVLGRTVLEFIATDHHGRWIDFAARVVDGTPASVECDLQEVAWRRRTVLFQGAPLPGHPDRVPSLLLTAHDVSLLRRLEDALTARAHECDTHARALATVQAECAQLRAALADRAS